MNKLFSELQSNQRLRWGCWLILGILWFYGTLLLRDGAQAYVDQYGGTLKQYSRLTALAGQKQWLERGEAAKLLKVQMEGRLWQAGTPGLAQATFQDWMSQTLTQAGTTRPALTVTIFDEKSADVPGQNAKEGAGEPVLADLWKITARAEFDFSPPSFYKLMVQLGSNERRVVIESLTIRKEPAPRADIVMVAYFQKGKGQAGATTGIPLNNPLNNPIAPPPGIKAPF